MFSLNQNHFFFKNDILIVYNCGIYFNTTFREHLLWVQVGPSQPSLQTQVNDSPATTQVPPFSHGFGRQLEFLAEGDKRGKNVFSVFFWAQTSEAYQ